MTVQVADVAAIMAALAPPELAEEWDNCGLQVGDPRWPVRRIMVALDPLPEVVQEACDHEIDLLVTHHPLLMRSPKKIDFSDTLGGIVSRCATHQLAIYAAHTNLDAAVGGLNDHLADLLQLHQRRPMAAAAGPSLAKLVVFVPAEAEAAVRTALFSAGAGEIGRYSHCAFRLEGQGSFLPGKGSRPAVGEVGRDETVDEVRLETLIPTGCLDNALALAEKAHPYETMAWDAYPLLTMEKRAGLGRVGDLSAAMPLEALARSVKTALGTASVRVVGDPQMSVTTIALCTGGGGSLLADFFSSGAHVFITGDVRYHDARSVEAAGKGMIDVGHFASERIVVNHLVTQLGERLAACRPRVSIQAATSEQEPFILV